MKKIILIILIGSSMIPDGMAQHPYRLMIPNGEQVDSLSPIIKYGGTRMENWLGTATPVYLESDQLYFVTSSHVNDRSLDSLLEVEYTDSTGSIVSYPVKVVCQDAFYELAILKPLEDIGEIGYRLSNNMPRSSLKGYIKEVICNQNLGTYDTTGFYKLMQGSIAGYKSPAGNKYHDRMYDNVSFKATLGSSGGPILNQDDELVGIISAVSVHTGHTRFLSLSSLSHVIERYDRLKNGYRYTSLQRVFLGLVLVHSGSRNGVRIFGCLGSSPLLFHWRKGTIQKDDVITHVNGQRVSSLQDMFFELENYYEKQTIELSLLSNGNSKNISLAVDVWIDSGLREAATWYMNQLIGVNNWTVSSRPGGDDIYINGHGPIKNLGTSWAYGNKKLWKVNDLEDVGKIVRLSCLTQFNLYYRNGSKRQFFGTDTNFDKVSSSFKVAEGVLFY